MKLKVFRRITDSVDSYVCVNVGRRKKYEVRVIQVDSGKYNVVVEVSAYNSHIMPSEAGAFAKSYSRRYLRINKEFTSLSEKDIELIKTNCPKVLLNTAFGYWVHWLYSSNSRIKSDKYRRLVDWGSEEAKTAVEEVDSFVFATKNKEKQ